MGVTPVLFWVLSVMALFSALMVITSKNPMHSVIWLIIVFFAISGHYLLLNAQFLAIVNIIVYAGAIMVFTIANKKSMAEISRRCGGRKFIISVDSSIKES